MVHADATDEGPLAVGVSESGEEVGGRDMGGGVVSGGGGAVTKERGNGAVVDTAGVGEGGERGFEGKGVGFKPGKKS